MEKVEGRYITIELLKNRNIEIKATEEGIVCLKENINSIIAFELWGLLLEDFLGNGIYEQVDDGSGYPAIGYGVSRDEEQNFIESEGFWYFDNYVNVYEIEKLANGESVIFTSAE